MKIALLTDGIWPFVVGGMQKHSYYLCKYLAQQGVQVDLYYTNKHQQTAADVASVFEKEELQYIRFINVLFPPSVYFPGHYLWELYQYSKKVYNQLKDHVRNYDIVYVQGLAGWYFLKQKTKNNFSTPVVLNFHGLNMFQKVADRRSRTEQLLFKPIVKKLLCQSDYIQSLGGQLTTLLYEQGLKKEKIIEIGIGIEKSWLTRSVNERSNDSKTFVFVGRYDRIKGITELYEALSLLRMKYYFKFHFIGPIPQEKRLNDINIHYHGILTEEDAIKRIFDSSDFLVLPSYSEGMPTVILEAMARGCAIIATNVGAVSNMVSADNGILIRPSSAEEIYSAMVKGIEMGEKELINMKKASLEKIEKNFLWEQLIIETVCLFNSISKSKRIV